MAIKLVAIDIDATLINDQRQITERTKQAIKKASQQGVKVVLCTGRPMTGVDGYLTELGLNHQDNEYVKLNYFDFGVASTDSEENTADCETTGKAST